MYYLCSPLGEEEFHRVKLIIQTTSAESRMKTHKDTNGHGMNEVQ
jgi:hypothetical protein